MLVCILCILLYIIVYAYHAATFTQLHKNELTQTTSVYKEINADIIVITTHR